MPGCFQPEIRSFRLRLASEGKAARAVLSCTEGVQWFADAHLRRAVGRTGWEELCRQYGQRWTVWLLERHSAAYASNQSRVPGQFFKGLTAEDDLPWP